MAGVNMVEVSIGELLLSERHWFRGGDDRPDCIYCSDRAHSKGRQYRCSQCRLGLPYTQEQPGLIKICTSVHFLCDTVLRTLLHVSPQFQREMSTEWC